MGLRIRTNAADVRLLACGATGAASGARAAVPCDSTSGCALPASTRVRPFGEAVEDAPARGGRLHAMTGRGAPSAR
eukprot:scaffold152536_cov30-Tisochrysis_lutea.AAC.8